MKKKWIQWEKTAKINNIAKLNAKKFEVSVTFRRHYGDELDISKAGSPD